MKSPSQHPNLSMGLRLSRRGGSMCMYPHWYQWCFDLSGGQTPLTLPILSNDKTNLAWFSQRYKTLIYKRYKRKVLMLRLKEPSVCSLCMWLGSAFHSSGGCWWKWSSSSTQCSKHLSLGVLYRTQCSKHHPWVFYSTQCSKHFTLGVFYSTQCSKHLTLGVFYSTQCSKHHTLGYSIAPSVASILPLGYSIAPSVASILPLGYSIAPSVASILPL